MSNLNDTFQMFDLNSGMRITAKTGLGADFTLVRVKPFHDAVVEHFKSPRIATGDERFDREILICSDDPRVEKAFRQSAEARLLAYRIIHFHIPSTSSLIHLPHNQPSEIICKHSQVYIQIHSTDSAHDSRVFERFQDCQPLLDHLVLALHQVEPDFSNSRNEPSHGQGDLLFISYAFAAVSFALLAFWFFWEMKSESIDWDISRSSWGWHFFIFVVLAGFSFSLAFFTHRRSTRLPLAMDHARSFAFLSLLATPILFPYLNAKLPSPYPIASFCSAKTPQEKNNYPKHFFRGRRGESLLYLDPPTPQALALSGAVGIEWKGFKSNHAWVAHMSAHNQFKVTIQKGLLGVPLVRSIEACKNDCSCPISLH